MTPIRGVIKTEATPDKGRWVFIIAMEGTQEILPCVTGPAFSGSVPEPGTKVTIAGERPSDLISGDEMPYFVVSGIGS